MNTAVSSSPAPTLLQINSSLFSSGGQSSQLADAYVARWRAAHPHGRVIVRDLAQHPLPHLDAARVGAFFSKPESRSAEQQAVLDESDTLIDELRNAQHIVIGLPMYNFGLPSTLKAYFDHIARAGVTFRYTAEGPIGLLPNVPVSVFAARGGLYVGTPRDTQTAYVRDFLAFVGLTQVEFVYAEGLNLGDDAKHAALTQAQQRISELAA